MDEAERDFIVTTLATNSQAFLSKEVQTVEQPRTDRVMRMETTDIECGNVG